MLRDYLKKYYLTKNKASILIIKDFILSISKNEFLKKHGIGKDQCKTLTKNPTLHQTFLLFIVINAFLLFLVIKRNVFSLKTGFIASTQKVVNSDNCICESCLECRVYFLVNMCKYNQPYKQLHTSVPCIKVPHKLNAYITITNIIDVTKCESVQLLIKLTEHKIK